MAQVKIVDIINPYQVAKDQKVTLENQLTAANATLAEKAPEIKTALTGLPSKSVFLLNASGKVTVYILDAATPEGFRAFDPDSSDATVDIPDSPSSPVTPAGPTPVPGGTVST